MDPQPIPDPSLFFRLKAGQGYGLGLSMFTACKQSGGAFRLKSVSGQGTTGEMCVPSLSKESIIVNDKAIAPVSPGLLNRDFDTWFVDDDCLVLMEGRPYSRIWDMCF